MNSLFFTPETLVGRPGQGSRGRASAQDSNIARYIVRSKENRIRDWREHKVPRRNKRKKNKYEKLRYLTRRDLRAFHELDAMRVDVSGGISTSGNTGNGESRSHQGAHPIYRSAVENQSDLHDLYKEIAPKRGEIWYVDLGEFDRSSVQRGIRPAVIVSSDIANEKSGVVTVVPLTSKMKKTWYPSHILINNDDLETAAPTADISEATTGRGEDGARETDGSGEAAAQKPKKAIMPSQILAEQLQTVDKQYLGKRVGKVKHLKMLEIEEGMRESLTL